MHHPTRLRNIGLLIILALTAISIALYLITPVGLFAQGSPNCSAPYLIDETLPLGTRWQMCWELRAQEGIVFYDIYYTPPNGSAELVLAQANLAQIHVPYDDNGARYHDLSDLGLGNFINDLTAADCRNGSLIQNNSVNVMCRQQIERGYAYKYYDDQLQGDGLRLFSVSHMGAYNYIAQWDFNDDGSIVPAVGATGSLQRYNSGSPEFGWPLAAGNSIIGISHVHNYYWRLDFDIGDNINDQVEQFEFNPNPNNTQFVRTSSTITTETALSVSPQTMRSWRVLDPSLTNADGHSPSYHLEPLEVGHQFIGPAYEPWTFNDIYFTAYNPCEKFASHNPITGGCGNHLQSFVNGEDINNADVVLWYGMSFHHLPRDEDEPRMHTHWSGFELIPRDWTAENPLPTATPIPPPTNTPSWGTAVPLRQ